ncbi:nodulin-26-like [Pistacia vera]|uniref:nodulin-26-like n=1 Tax=Pistacia vera TaxID=55513 RepID=UPI001263529B|nr:nodulin-26-like [Pistacia vera]
MAQVSVPNNLRCSPKPPVSTDLSLIEEGKASPSVASTITVTTVSPTNAHKIIAELVGTFVIMFVGCASWMIDQRYHITLVGVAVAWGLVLMVMIYTLGHVSGAHFNPAVTFAFAASAKFPWRQVPVYVALQLAGSTLAVLTLAMLFRDQINIGVTVTRYLRPTTHCEAFAWEFILSFILMLTICGVAADSRAINELSGVTVGATMLFDVLIAGSITGASMNPARSIGPALVSGQLHSLWLYILAPILGTTTASSIYCLVWLPLPEKFDDRNIKE